MASPSALFVFLLLAQSSDAIRRMVVEDEGGLVQQQIQLTTKQRNSTTQPLWSCKVTNIRSGRSLQIVKELASGDGGTAYLAEERPSHQKAVVKTFHITDKIEVESLKAISDMSPKPQHLNMLEPGFEDQRNCCGKSCVVIQLVGGKTLAEIRKAGAPMRYETLRTIILQNFLGWVEMERAGICSTDQHLGNIMFEAEPPRVVLIDFGYANKTTTCTPLSWVMHIRRMGKLLQDSHDREKYLEMCNEVQKLGSIGAKKALLRVVFGTTSMSEELKPIGFFALHSIEAFKVETDQAIEILKLKGTPQAPLDNESVRICLPYTILIAMILQVFHGLVSHP